MADEALFGLLRQTADLAVVKALKTSIETDQDRLLNRINPSRTPRRTVLTRGDDRRLCSCGAARTVRHVVEHVVPVVRRSHRVGRGAQEP